VTAEENSVDISGGFLQQFILLSTSHKTWYFPHLLSDLGEIRYKRSEFNALAIQWS